MESVGPVVPTNEVETKFETIEVDNMESVGPVVPTNEVETKFETIEVTNGVCGPSGPNK